MNHIAPISIFIALLFALPTHANDSIASLNTQGLVLEKTDSIAMKKEVLKISPTKIEVEYDFLNESDKDIKTTVAFPLPPGRCNSYTSVPMAVVPSFKAFVEGKTIVVMHELKAFVSEKDVTSILKKYGIAPESCPSPESYSPKVKQQLIAEGLLTKGNENIDSGDPAWSYQEKYYWTMTFPARKVIKVKHSYKPGLGSDSSNGINFQSIYADLLFNDEPEGMFGDALMKWANQNRLEVNGAYANKTMNTNGAYILTTGNNWKNGIESFELTVSGAQLVFLSVDKLCYSGIGKLVYKAKNFRPATDISFSFGYVAKSIPSQFFEEHEIDGPANLRDKINGKIIASIPDKTKVTVIDSTGSWLKVRFGEKIGYTNENNLVYASTVHKAKNLLGDCITAAILKNNKESFNWEDRSNVANKEECIKVAQEKMAEIQKSDIYKKQFDEILGFRTVFNTQIVFEKPGLKFNK